MQRGRASVLAVALAGLATSGLPATTAFGTHQVPGCDSTARHTGELISPALDLTGIEEPFIQFNTWWEIESAGPVEHDLMTVQYSLNGGATWLHGALLNEGL